MSLADRLAAPPSDAHYNSGCTIGKWIATLDPDEADAVNTAMDNPKWRHVDLTEILQDEGLDITSHTVGRHRRGGCRCDDAGLTP